MIILMEVVTAILALLNGAICFINPALAIKIQQKFYEKINWKIEPVNLSKELKNTRIMGLISLMLAVLILIQIFKK